MHSAVTINQTLRDPTDKPFIVKASDVDLFDSDDTLELFQVAESTKAVDQVPFVGRHRDSLTHHATKMSLPSFSKRSRSRRASVGSLSMSSASSISSQSLRFDDDESLASHFSQDTQRSKQRRLSTRRAKTAEKVTFHRRIKIRPIPRLDCISDEEVSATWYNQQELAAIKEAANEDLQDEMEVRRKLSRRYDLCDSTCVYTTTLLTAEDSQDTVRWT